MTTIKVEGMHCEGCVDRITKAMTAAGLTFEVSLLEKTVRVEGGDKEVQETKEILDDLGFDV